MKQLSIVVTLPVIGYADMLTGSRQTTAMYWDHCFQMVYLSNALTDVLKVKRAGGERS